MTTQIGQRAEEVATLFLEGKGYHIVTRNWRIRWCEIDIVATRAGRVFFAEVKYRKKAFWGTGLEYITPRKLQQMHFAARLWIAKQGWTEDYTIAVIEVSGPQFLVTQWISDIYA